MYPICTKNDKNKLIKIRKKNIKNNKKKKLPWVFLSFFFLWGGGGKGIMRVFLSFWELLGVILSFYENFGSLGVLFQFKVWKHIANCFIVQEEYVNFFYKNNVILYVKETNNNFIDWSVETNPVLKKILFT